MFGNAMNPGCGCCGGGGGGDTVVIAACASCPIPTSLTLTWYYNGYAQNPCAGGPHGTYGTNRGPLTTTLRYSAVAGNWTSDWVLGPCWPFGDSESFGQQVPPYGCIYQRFIWTCVNLGMFLQLSQGPNGPPTTGCVATPTPTQNVEPNNGQGPANLCPVLLLYTGSDLFNHGILTP